MSPNSRRTPDWQHACCALALSLSACARSNSDATLPPNSARLVVTPSSIAALSADNPEATVPGAIVFGGPSGRSALYLRFPAAWRARSPLLKGFIALSPSASAAIDTQHVTIEVWRVSSDWQASQLHDWSDKPQLALPYVRAELGAQSQGLRINVTELLRFAEQHRDRDFGIALVARGGSGHGKSFNTGIAGGTAPRLEIYLR